MNDLPTVVTSCTINLYADDTAIYYANKDPDHVTHAINDDLLLIATWIESNKLTMNVSKTQMMVLVQAGCQVMGRTDQGTNQWDSHP